MLIITYELSKYFQQFPFTFPHLVIPQEPYNKFFHINAFQLTLINNWALLKIFLCLTLI